MSAITFSRRAATQAEHEKTVNALKAHTQAAIGIPVVHQPFSLIAEEDGAMVGSVIGKIFFNWLHVDLIWVDTHYQRHGIGTSLMQQCELYVHEHNMQGIEVWTQSWQAPEFYRKLGYHELAVIDDFTPGRKRHAFRYTASKESQ